MTAAAPGAPSGERVSVLLAAGSAAWEPTALTQLARPTGPVTLHRRCLDLPDLLSAASTGIAHVALVAGDLGLDADACARLLRAGVRPVVVDDPVSLAAEERLTRRARWLRLGVALVVEPDAVGDLGALLRRVAGAQPDPASSGPDTSAEDCGDLPVVTRGRVLAVWGAHGAPGRTTVALGLGAVAARGGRRTCVVDADVLGGSAGQQLGVLEEVSGLLAAARLVDAGELTREQLAGVAREVVPRLRLVTGLPRPDRWVELRADTLQQLLAVARTLDDLVVVDAGSGLPDAAADPYGPETREEQTSAVLEAADQVLLVATPDPVGLARMARSLQQLGERVPDVPCHVVLNRMRSSVGFRRAEIVELVGQVRADAPVTFLPEDAGAADRAVAGGRTLVECGDGPLTRALGDLLTEVAPTGAARAVGDRGRVRRARLRRRPGHTVRSR